MSFDPREDEEEASSRRFRNEPRRPRRPLDRFDEDDDGGRRGRSPRDDAAAQTFPPAILMLACAVLNVPVVLFCAWTFFFHMWMNVDDFVANQQQVKALGLNNDEVLKNPSGYLLQIRITYGVLTAFLSMTTLLVLLGSIQMLRLRGYALSLIGAFALTTPCVTACCIVGQIVGIWALVVLFTASVREQFR
jgi:hypothetical protein